MVRTKWYGQNGIEMVPTKWYLDKMVVDKMVMDKMARIKWYRLRFLDLIHFIHLKKIL
jgi:hypothetical protein